MNLRQKFLWNVILSVSAIILIWNSWNQFYKFRDAQKAYKKFKNEKVGTDKELQDMVVELEQNLHNRQTMKFRLKDNPLDLTKVIALDGNIASRGIKGIDCKAAWSNGDGTYSAMCFYKTDRYEVTIGDSIGGGIVTSVTDSKVFIKKDEQDIKFNFGLDKYEKN